MRHLRACRRRLRLGALRRPVAWLIAFAFLMQALAGNAAMLRMMSGDVPLAVAFCLGGETKDPGPAPGLPIRDHAQCLLCHGGLGPQALPPSLLLPPPKLGAPAAAAVASAAVAPIPGVRANAARGPPIIA